MPLDGTTFCLRAPKQLSLPLGDPDTSPAVILGLMEHRFASGTWRWIKIDLKDGENGFCLLGGVFEAAGDCPEMTDCTLSYLVHAIYGQRMRHLSAIATELTIAGYNDRHTFVDVMEILAKAKALAEADGR